MQDYRTQNAIPLEVLAGKNIFRTEFLINIFIQNYARLQKTDAERPWTLKQRGLEYRILRHCHHRSTPQRDRQPRYHRDHELYVVPCNLKRSHD